MAGLDRTQGDIAGPRGQIESSGLEGGAIGSGAAPVRHAGRSASHHADSRVPAVCCDGICTLGQRRAPGCPDRGLVPLYRKQMRLHWTQGSIALRMSQMRYYQGEGMFNALMIDKDEKGYRTSLGQLDTAQLPDGEVLVDIRYSTLNYKDAL